MNRDMLLLYGCVTLKSGLSIRQLFRYEAIGISCAKCYWVIWLMIKLV